MALKKKVEEHENLERWMVSYADFLTLMFAFFVVMYSVSSLNEGKYRVMAESISAAITHSPSPSKGKPAGGQININLKDFIKQARAEKRGGEILREVQQIKGVATMVQLLDTGTILTLGGHHPFDTGEYILKAEHAIVLDEIKEAMRGKLNVVEVRGYTSGFPEDSLVTENGVPRKYRAGDPREGADHWLLSYMRAKAVADYLINTDKSSPRVDPEQVKILVLGANDREVAEQHSKDEEHARQNRRVEVKITNDTMR